MTATAADTPAMVSARMKRIARASAAAGPMFVTCAMAADVYLRLPAPVAVDLGAALGLPLLWIPAALFGWLIALAPNMLGALCMETLARAFPPARAPEAWALVGGAAAGTPAWLLGGEPNWTFAFAATGALCALICRGHGAPDALPTGASRG